MTGQERGVQHGSGISPGRRLDYIPAPLALLVACVPGLAVGVAVAGLSPWIGGPLFAACLGLGAWLASRGRAVVELTRPEPEHAKERDDEDEDVLEEPPAPPGEPDEPDELPLDPLAMESIPAGRFLMGSPDDDPDARDSEKPQHPVEVSAFRCMVYPVTRGLYAEVMEHDPGWPEADAIDEVRELPANKLSWNDAVEFCNRLSRREGLEPCYRVGDDGEVTWDREADGYRLPTEAEWEYACRSGTQTRWSSGDDPAELGEYAWYVENSDGTPHPVGRKKPNEWGLHDMHGNVFEWCWDGYGAYEDNEQTNPEGPGSGWARLLRGGSFVFRAWFLRCADRYRYHPVGRVLDVGFRCVRGVPRQLRPLES